MKYIYKRTGTVVESEKKLNRALFQPAEETKPAKAPEKAKRTTAAKK